VIDPYPSFVGARFLLNNVPSIAIHCVKYRQKDVFFPQEDRIFLHIFRIDLWGKTEAEECGFL
jgi:hypothetical protein